MRERDASIARASQRSRRRELGTTSALGEPSCAPELAVYPVCAQVRTMLERIQVCAVAITMLGVVGCGSLAPQSSVEESIAKAVTVDGAQKKDAALIEAKAKEERQRKASEKQALEQSRAAEN